MTKRNIFFSILFICTVFLSAQELVDVIYLKDGTEMRGFIIEQVPGNFIVLEKADGSKTKILFKEIDRLKRERQKIGTQKELAEYTAAEIEAMITRKMPTIVVKTMHKASAPLSYEERKSIYEDNKKNPKHGLLNLIPGFGVGSYLQGDTGIAIFQSISEGVSVLFFPLMLALAKNSDSSGTLDKSDIIMAAAISGSMYAGFRIPAIIRPFRYAFSFNRRLKMALHLDKYNDLGDNPKALSMTLRPLFIINQNKKSDEHDNLRFQAGLGLDFSF